VTATAIPEPPVGVTRHRITHRPRRVPAHPPRQTVRCARTVEPENTRPRLQPPLPPVGDRRRPRNPYRCRVSGRLRVGPRPRAEFYVNGNPLNLDDPNGHRPICDDCTTADQKALSAELGQEAEANTEQLYQEHQVAELALLARGVYEKGNGSVYGAVPIGQVSPVDLVENLGSTYNVLQSCLSTNGYTGGRGGASLNSAEAGCGVENNAPEQLIESYLSNGGSAQALANVGAEAQLISQYGVNRIAQLLGPAPPGHLATELPETAAVLLNGAVGIATAQQTAVALTSEAAQEYFQNIGVQGAKQILVCALALSTCKGPDMPEVGRNPAVEEATQAAEEAATNTGAESAYITGLPESAGSITLGPDGAITVGSEIFQGGSGAAAAASEVGITEAGGSAGELLLDLGIAAVSGE
jgi:hypothetical protein